ncbi:MAG: YbhN family protein [Candidatus Heimdallarchaeota archaeon]
MPNRYYNLVIYALTFSVLLLLLIWINPETLVDKLLHLGIWVVSILSVLYFIDLIVRTYRWKILLQAQGVDLSMKTLAPPTVSALAINLFTIARAGETVRLYVLKRYHDTRYADTFSSIVIEQVLSVISLLVVIIGSLIAIGGSLPQTSDYEVLQTLIFLLFIITGIGLCIIAIFSWHPEIGIRFISLFPKFLEIRLSSAYRSFILGVSDLSSTPSLLIKGLVTSIAIWLLEGVMLFVIATSVFPVVELIDLPWAISASAAGNITFFFPILPGSIGGYEVMVAFVLINAPNYPGTFATLVAVIDRVMKTFILGLLGGYSIIKLGGNELIRVSKDSTFRESFKDITPQNDEDSS